MTTATAKTTILELIGKGKTDDQIIAATLKAFPKSKVDGKHCTKYRKIYAAEGGANGDIYSAFGSKEHQAWGAKNPKVAVTAKCPHNGLWKDRVARHKAADVKAAAAKAAAAKKAKAKKAA